MKTILLEIIWIMMEITITCYAHPHYSNYVDTVGNYNGKAMRKLLQLFGLDENVYHREKNHLLPPQYMLDLYNFYSNGSIQHRKSRYTRANTVRSFYDKAESDSGEYFFDLLNSISLDEEIVDAEFHFFTNSDSQRHSNNSNLIQIHVYEGERNTNSKLLHARMASVHSAGWEVFKVTTTVRKWVSNPAENLGFTVEVLDKDGREWTSQQVQLLSNHRRPILIIFSKDPKTKSATLSPVNSRIANNPNERHKREAAALNISRTTRSVQNHGHCMRHELRVDFDRLGWSAWIISPKWYDAYLCAGACAFPLGQNQRPTNHATVQSIVHELGLIKGVRAPCCVPTDLKPVSLLYFDEHNNVVLKQYDDMVASGCGCQ